MLITWGIIGLREPPQQKRYCKVSARRSGGRRRQEVPLTASDRKIDMESQHLMPLSSITCLPLHTLLHLLRSPCSYALMDDLSNKYDSSPELSGLQNMLERLRSGESTVVLLDRKQRAVFVSCLIAAARPALNSDGNIVKQWLNKCYVRNNNKEEWW